MNAGVCFSSITPCRLVFFSQLLRPDEESTSTQRYIDSRTIQLKAKGAWISVEVTETIKDWVSDPGQIQHLQQALTNPNSRSVSNPRVCYSAPSLFNAIHQTSHHGNRCKGRCVLHSLNWRFFFELMEKERLVDVAHLMLCYPTGATSTWQKVKLKCQNRVEAGNLCHMSWVWILRLTNYSNATLHPTGTAVWELVNYLNR